MSQVVGGALASLAQSPTKSTCKLDHDGLFFVVLGLLEPHRRFHQTCPRSLAAHSRHWRSLQQNRLASLTANAALRTQFAEQFSTAAARTRPRSSENPFDGPGVLAVSPVRTERHVEAVSVLPETVTSSAKSCFSTSSASARNALPARTQRPCNNHEWSEKLPQHCDRTGYGLRGTCNGARHLDENFIRNVLNQKVVSRVVPKTPMKTSFPTYKNKHLTCWRHNLCGKLHSNKFEKNLLSIMCWRQQLH